MRSKRLGPVLAALLAAVPVAPAAAQTVAYTNFLRFDLQSFTSQATAGMFDDDIEMVSDASKLMGVDGGRLFTSFSNLSDPAGLGDNVLSYSVDHVGEPASADHFDTGSYLLGWIGKHDRESEYTHSFFYKRNQATSMFENLEDGQLGSVDLDGLDAEYTGSVTSIVLSGTEPNVVVADSTTNFELRRYDERTATDLDFAVARDLSADLSVGGRIFYERDRVDSFADGVIETVSREDHDADAGTPLVESFRTVTEYSGNGEGAFQYREVGLSIDANYHPWADQSVGIRLDLFGSALTNPGDLASPLSRAGEPLGPHYGGWTRVNLQTNNSYERVAAGDGALGGTTTGLLAPHEIHSWNTMPFSYPGYGSRGPARAVESVDDDRDGMGFHVKAEYNREVRAWDVNSWIGFGHRGLDLSATSVTVERNGRTFPWSDGLADFTATETNLDHRITTRRSGDTSLRTLEAGGRFTRDLNATVSVGLGAVLTRDTWTDDFRETTDDVLVTDGFDDGAAGDNALHDATGATPAYDERSTTRSVTNSSDVRNEVETTVLRLPVGTQFHFKKRWTFQMGAQHMITGTTRITDVSVPPGGNGRVTVTTASVTGGTTISHPTSADVGSTQVTQRSRSNRTTYWYGLSVDITDAVQLDINGFLDTNSTDNDLERGLPSPRFTGSGSFTDADFWRNLAISLKYIFW